MLASVGTYALIGIEARDVTVEVDVTSGLPSFAIVGLPDAAVRESRERVRSAIQNSGFDFPQSRITASLAPADLRKAGPGFDLAIAAAVLVAHGELPAAALAGTALAELALDGSLRPVPGALAMAERACAGGVERIVVAPASAHEAALPSGVAGAGTQVFPLERLADLRQLGTPEARGLKTPAPALETPVGDGPDLADLRGQPALRDALEVAAAGGHGILIMGPPGAGKSLAARRLPSIMPPLSEAEALEVLRIASACGRRPDQAEFAGRSALHITRSHRRASSAAATRPRAGEVTLAHGGVLFLDGSASSHARRSRHCGSRSRTVWSRSRASGTR